MKNIKMLFIALLALVAGAFASCVSDPYTPGKPVDGPQVFFPKNNPTSIGFLEESGKGKFELTLKRVATDKDLWVYVIIEPHDNMDKESIKEFAMPTEYEAYFEAGSDTATIEIEVKELANLFADKTYTYNFVIEDVYSTPYGDKEWRVDFSIDPWLLVKDANGNNAKAKLRAGSLLAEFWGVTSLLELEVDLYKHKNSELYKIRNPWASIFEIAFGYSKEILSDPNGGVFTFNNADLVFDCTNPNSVTIEKQSTGVNEFYNKYGVAYIEGRNGSLEDGVITFPKGNMYFCHEKLLELYKDQMTWADFKCDLDGMFRLLFPGVKAKDYDLGVSYDGMEVGLDNEQAYAKFAFAYGVDVAAIKYLIVNGDIEYYSNDIATAVATLEAGTDENICTVENFVKGDNLQNVKLALKHGLYTIVAVPVDENGKVRSKEVAVSPFYFVGLGANPDISCHLEVALTDVGTKDFSQLTTHPDYVSMALVVKGELLKEAQYFFVETSELEQFIKQEIEIGAFTTTQEVYDYVLEVSGNTVPTDKILETHNNGEMVSYFGGINPEYQLKPETSYSILFRAKNSYGKETFVTNSFSTSKAPLYTGKVVLGEYEMANTFSYKDENNKTQTADFKNVFKLSNIVGFNDQFFVTNLGMEDGYSWYAQYDSATKSLILNGTVKTMLPYGNLFNYMQIGLAADEYGNMVACTTYWTIDPENKQSQYNDPLIIEIDETTLQPKGLKTELRLPYIVFSSMTDYELYGWLGVYEAGKTTIAPYVATEEDKNEDNGGNEIDGPVNNDNGNTYRLNKNAVMKASSKSLSIPFCSKGVIKALKPYSKQLHNHAISEYAAPAQPKVSFVKPTSVESYTPEAKSLRSIKFNAR